MPLNCPYRGALIVVGARRTELSLPERAFASPQRTRRLGAFANARRHAGMAFLNDGDRAGSAGRREDVAISIVIPVYNEADGIAEFNRRLTSNGASCHFVGTERGRVRQRRQRRRHLRNTDNVARARSDHLSR